MSRVQSGELWWKNAVVYGLDVETFADSNGDGVGDLPGLTDRLDHIAALGATCLWLLPIHPTPNRDDGYDVTDFYAIDPRLGTLGDFVTFERAARERGLRVLLDLVVNHTSDQHPWFVESRSSREAPRRDWYVWADEPDPSVEQVIFPGEQEGNWTLDEQTGQWYFHRFHPHQPDLNMANPDVRTELMQIMGFWLELGVSGFRLDALPFLIQDVQDPEARGQRHHEWLRAFRSFVSQRRGDAILIGEANVEPKEMAEYFGDGDEAHLLFNYSQSAHLLASLALASGRPTREALEGLPEVSQHCGWLNFTRLHDEANLERLDDADRAAVFDAFASDPSIPIYDRGLRTRLPTMLDRDRARLELAHVLTFASPGTPLVLYGEEIEMGDNLELPGRLSVRTPMQWEPAPSGGFTEAPPDALVRPFARPGPEETSVAAQRTDSGSFLHWLTRLIAARRRTRAIGLGPPELLDTGSDDVVAWRFTWAGEQVICLANLSREARRVGDLGVDASHRFEVILSSQSACPAEGAAVDIDLPPYGYCWLRATS